MDLESSYLQFVKSEQRTTATQGPVASLPVLLFFCVRNWEVAVMKAEELIAISKQSYDYEARECLNRLRKGGEEAEDEEDDDKRDKEEEEDEDDGWSV
jgi:hypothetical protein